MYRYKYTYTSLSLSLYIYIYRNILSFQTTYVSDDEQKQMISPIHISSASLCFKGIFEMQVVETIASPPYDSCTHDHARGRTAVAVVGGGKSSARRHCCDELWGGGREQAELGGSAATPSFF